MANGFCGCSARLAKRSCSNDVNFVRRSSKEPMPPTDSQADLDQMIVVNEHTLKMSTRGPLHKQSCQKRRFLVTTLCSLMLQCAWMRSRRRQSGVFCASAVSFPALRRPTTTSRICLAPSLVNCDFQKNSTGTN